MIMTCLIFLFVQSINDQKCALNNQIKMMITYVEAMFAWKQINGEMKVNPKWEK